MSELTETLTPPSTNGQGPGPPELQRQLAEIEAGLAQQAAKQQQETREQQEAAIERRLERRLATRLADLRTRYAQGGQTRGSLKRQLDEIEAAMAQLEGAIAALEQVTSGQG